MFLYIDCWACFSRSKMMLASIPAQTSVLAQHFAGCLCCQNSNEICLEFERGKLCFPGTLCMEHRPFPPSLVYQRRLYLPSNRYFYILLCKHEGSLQLSAVKKVWWGMWLWRGQQNGAEAEAQPPPGAGFWRKMRGFPQSSSSSIPFICLQTVSWTDTCESDLDYLLSSSYRWKLDQGKSYLIAEN